MTVLRSNGVNIALYVLNHPNFAFTTRISLSVALRFDYHYYYFDNNITLERASSRFERARIRNSSMS